MTSSIDKSQRTAASVVGFVYLFAMALSVFAESYVGGRLIVPHDSAETARNIVAHERLFRFGIASNVIIAISDVALIAALYVILKRIDEQLALFAAFVRLIGSGLYVAATLNYMDVLRLMSGDGHLQILGADQLQAMVRLSIGAYNAGLGVAFVFLGVGSTVFGYLWLKSTYIPRALAVLGMSGSFLLAVGSLTFVLSPTLWALIFPAYMAPLGLFEVGMGLLLLVKGLRPPTSRASSGLTASSGRRSTA